MRSHSLRMAASAGGARLLKRIMMRCCRRGGCEWGRRLGRVTPEEIMLKVQLGEGYSREGQQHEQRWGEQHSVGRAWRSEQERLAGASMLCSNYWGWNLGSHLWILSYQHTLTVTLGKQIHLWGLNFYLQNGISLRFKCKTVLVRAYEWHIVSTQ